MPETTGKGCLFLLSGPSGSGKDTILKQVLARLPDLHFSISATTRPRRDPSDDEKYHFMTREEFEQGIAAGAFLEHARYVDHYYGTPAGPIEAWRAKGEDVLVECEVQGALQIMQRVPDLTSIFIMPPSLAVLRRRLQNRQTETAEQTEKRIQTALTEMRAAPHYQYLVINDALEDAVSQVCGIITAGRAAMARHIDFINEVLQSC